MNYLERRNKNIKIGKKFKSKFKDNKFIYNGKVLNILTSLIDNEIMDHFVRSVDVTEQQMNMNLECVFYFNNCGEIFEAIVPYEIYKDEFHLDHKQILVTDIHNNTYDLDSKNLTIMTKNYNFNSKAIKEIIEDYIESQREEE